MNLHTFSFIHWESIYDRKLVILSNCFMLFSVSLLLWSFLEYGIIEHVDLWHFATLQISTSTLIALVLLIPLWIKQAVAMLIALMIHLMSLLLKFSMDPTITFEHNQCEGLLMEKWSLILLMERLWFQYIHLIGVFVLGLIVISWFTLGLCTSF